MTKPEPPRASNRLGFHYFNDTLHYREIDIRTWLPHIKACGATWLTLVTPHDRAIPENFVRGLIEENIEPVLHFHLPISQISDPDSLSLLLEVYASWGVRYVALFDRPNRRLSWPGNTWSQSELVERFLDIYIPAVMLVLKTGLVPVFPPLEPGGEYWDTAFLRAALGSILRRGHTQLAESIVLGAYAWVNEHELGWGAGGPEQWPQAKPYHTPPGQEDQRGFFISDWYLSIAEAELGQPIPMIIMAAGYNPKQGYRNRKINIDLDLHTNTNLSIARLMMGQSVNTRGENSPLLPPSANVLAGNFWLLAADKRSPDLPLAWFHPDTDDAEGRHLPIVDAMRQLHQSPKAKIFPDIHYKSTALTPASNRPIAHYLLLPPDSCEDTERLLSKLMPFVHEHQPTIGFSIQEAALAATVTAVGNTDQIPEDVLDTISSAGARVQRLSGDGTSIAPPPATHHTD